MVDIFGTAIIFGVFLVFLIDICIDGFYALFYKDYDFSEHEIKIGDIIYIDVGSLNSRLAKVYLKKLKKRMRDERKI
jgi:hypothetical protein